MRALALTLALAAPAAALEWAPLGGVTALGGLHAFDGQRGTFSGNASLDFSPAVRIDERWSALGTARASYEGTKRLNDVLGAATAAQERAELRLGARAIWGLPDSPWRVKPSASVTQELLKESRDESWGAGLFDQRRVTLGLELERLLREPHGLRLSVDWFEAVHENYSTLESQAALQYRGQSLARELVGDRALDRRGWQFGLSGDSALGERLVGEAGLAAVWSDFPSQRVIGESGLFEDRNRRDALGALELAGRMPHEWNADLRLLAGLELGASANSSNQSGYDASQGRYLPRFYDWYELKAAPVATLIVGPPRRPVTAALRLGLRRRVYPHRPAQDASGAYSGGALRTDEWTLGATLSYPMASRVAVLFQLERASARSNQGFERFYRYRYEATTALAGVRWDW